VREERRLTLKIPKEKPPRAAVQTALIGTSGKANTSDIDTALLDKLKKLRREIAAKENVPAYIVFPDATLQDICRKQPRTLVQFSEVHGVGEVKLEKYGELFVAIICGH
jgi:superfamily II DNA helicase RecQ